MKIAFLGSGSAAFMEGFQELVGLPVECRLLGAGLQDADERAWFEQADVVVGARLGNEHPVPTARLYQVIGAGYDGIDQDRLPAGCTLCNCYGHEPPIAEYVVAALLNRNIPFAEADRRLRQGDWTLGGGRDDALREEWSASTLGVVGYGHIGREIARKAKAFDVIVHAANRSPIDDAERVDRAWPLAELSAMCAEVDALVVTLPDNPETRGIVDAVALTALGAEGLVINVGRGPVVDEDALYDALAERRIAGAVIDTWYVYPSGEDRRPHPGRRPFHELPNVVMTPHFSGWTRQLVARRRRVMAENVRRLAAGDPLLNVVRPAA